MITFSSDSINMRSMVIRIIVKKLSSLQRLLRTTSANSQIKQQISPKMTLLRSRVTFCHFVRARPNGGAAGTASENPLSDSDKILHNGRGSRPHQPYQIWYPSVWGFRGQWDVKFHHFLLNCIYFRCRP